FFIWENCFSQDYFFFVILLYSYQLHGKYIMCGRDLLLSNEEIVRFEFQNKKHSLSRIFNELLDDWNVTLIHYRHYGSDMCSLLMGIDFPSDPSCNPQKEFFFLNLRSAGINFSLETSNPLLTRLIPAKQSY
ncbi:hypothetical protein IE077_003138, partial [Cardiosporidium cionae]